MIKPVKIIVIAVLMASLTACHHMENDRRAKIERDSQARGTSAGLGPRSLNVGECGLFLWATTGTQRPLIFFRRSDQATADILIAGATTVMRVDTENQSIIPGFFAEQQFKNADYTVRVRVQPENSRNLVQGIKIPSGVISYTGLNGTIMTPVSGLFGCKINQQQ